MVAPPMAQLYRAPHTLPYSTETSVYKLLPDKSI